MHIIIYLGDTNHHSILRKKYSLYVHEHSITYRYLPNIIFEKNKSFKFVMYFLK